MGRSNGLIEQKKLQHEDRYAITTPERLERLIEENGWFNRCGDYQKKKFFEMNEELDDKGEKVWYWEDLAVAVAICSSAKVSQIRQKIGEARRSYTAWLNTGYFLDERDEYGNFLK